MARRVGSKGQVVIEKEIRDRLGVRPGWLAVQQLVDDHVEIYFAPPEHDRSLAGALKRYSSVRLPSQESLCEAIERAWEAHGQERFLGEPSEPRS
jgi:AbrB family looped-hinge helix DNA binding protein